MPRAPFIASADDLTGAAEIAAFGFRHGLDAVIVFDANATSIKADLIVCDTDSRLDEPRVAAEKLSALGHALARRPREMFYKKTDSVLRGSVRAEVEALARALGLLRVLLLPANPTLGRTIRGGRYAIDGVPLHQTEFARDPHHPAKSDLVSDLLGNTGSLALTVHDATGPLPPSGLVVCNATSAAEVHGWARHATAADLPAGGGEFFSALLGEHGLKPSARSGAFSPGSPTLIVSGTTSPAGAILRDRAHRDGVAIVPLPEILVNETAPVPSALAVWIESVRSHLAASGAAVVVFDGPVVSGAQVAAAIRRAFAQCVSELVRSDALRHVIVEGGATAAAIVHKLNWRELRLTHEWSHGVASLRPVNHVSTVLTMKPGSYAWPDTLWQHILHSRPTTTPSSREKSP